MPLRALRGLGAVKRWWHAPGTRANATCVRHSRTARHAHAVSYDASDFQRDGCTVVRNLLTTEETATLRRGIEVNLANPSARALVASGSDDPGLFFEDFCTWSQNKDYEAVIRTSQIGRVAADLLRSRECRLFHDHLLVKEPGTCQVTPWHQDQPFYNVQGRQNVSFWIPVDPVPADSSLRIIAGSHTGPWLMPRTFLTREARWFKEGTLDELPDYDGDLEADAHAHRVCAWDLQPGDAVAFHMLAVHSAPGFVHGKGRRRVFSVRVLGDDMTHAPRPWKTSPQIDELDGHPAEAALDLPIFPLLHPRVALNE